MTGDNRTAQPVSPGIYLAPPAISSGKDLPQPLPACDLLKEIAMLVFLALWACLVTPFLACYALEAHLGGPRA